MKRHSASCRCVLINTFQHTEIIPFPLSFFQRPHRQSPWQIASTNSSLANPQWISATTTEHMDSVYPPSVVRHASFDLVVQVLITSTEAISSCHPTWKHVKLPRKTYIAKTKLAQPLNQVFQHVLIDRLNFPSYSIGAARKSIPEGV